MDRTLSKGMTGSDVRAVQDALNYQIRRGLTPLAIDGIFGPKTEARVTEFQTANNLVVDGIVGPQTKSLLFEVTEFSTALLLPDSHHFPLDSQGFPQVNFKFPHSILTWPGEGQLPSPFKPISWGTISVPPGGQGMLPDVQGPIAAVSFKILVPTRHDRRDPSVPKVPEIQVIQDMTDKPVGGGTKFKYKLDDGGWVTSGPIGAMLPGGGWRGPLPKMTKRVDPRMFAWGVAPGWNATHGIGFNGSAQFMVRVTNGPRDPNGRPKPQIDIGCWGQLVARIGRGIGIPVTVDQRAKTIWQAQCGSVIQF